MKFSGSIFFLGISAFMLGGCGVSMQEEADSAFKMFNKDQFYERALSDTKSSQIINSLETKAKITATYLNKVDSKYSGSEYFFVGVYIVNDDDDSKKAGLANKSYKLYINNTDKKAQNEPQVEAEIVETLRSEDDLVRKMPHTENWSRYYIVKFPSQKAGTITLEYKSEYGKAVLNFPKI